uniref:Polyprotein n=1 Tax=Cannabis sativa TaxID=3483 RepID=A0A803QDR5_CANSA
MTTPSDIIESSSQLSTHTTPVSMPLTASPSLRRSSGSKLDALYEVSYLSDDGKVILSDLPLINPYQAFSKPQNLFTRSIKTLIKQNPKTVKEYVQSTKFDQCNLPATEQEQLALTHHGRKGLPVCARITLLDTRMRKFQHASIGTLEATLNAGTIIVTFYPNFSMSLWDKRLLDALKVQLQIVGIDQDPDSLGSTLHYQMACRVQNHAIDISIPGSSDALMITVDTNHVTTCIHIPRQITTEELQQILPTSWITNYEKTQKPLPSIHSADPVFKSKKDGSIKISFPKNETTPRVFSTQYMMSTIIPEAA